MADVNIFGAYSPVCSGDQLRKSTSAIVVQLVNPEKTKFSRKNKDHVVLKDFEQLINQTPFQKFRGKNSSISSTPQTALKNFLYSKVSLIAKSPASTEITLRHGSNDSLNLSGNTSVNLSGILKDEKNSRFSRRHKRTRTHTGIRKVTIVENILPKQILV